MMSGRLKAAIVRLVLWGLLPAGVAEGLLRLLNLREV